jgi:protein-disulfide isomerase
MPKLTANRVLVVVLLVAAGLAAALIAVSVMGGSDEAEPATVHGAAATEELLAGIPQQGNVLGKADAPVTLVEYADLQCPYCAQWSLDTFPTLVREYARPGKVKIVFKGLAFVGPDSLPALQTAVSAGEQGKLWNVAELIYKHQGEENTGWVRDDLLRSIGDAVPGLDAGKMMEGRQSAAVASALADAQASAQAAGITSTPTFEIGRTGGSMTQLQGALPIAEFRQVLDALLSP